MDLKDLFTALPKTPRPARLSPHTPSVSKPIPATFVDLVDDCEHGHGITRYMRTALYLLPGPWFTKHGVAPVGCVFEAQWPYFQDLDAKCRGYHKANPSAMLKDVVRKFI